MRVIEQFAQGVVVVCLIVMRGVGVIDNLFSQMMIALGIYDPRWQLYILLAVMAFYVVLSLRAVGGFLGWGMLLFAVLLLLHRTLPQLSPPGLVIFPHLQSVL